jgi:hypothetical protein
MSIPATFDAFRIHNDPAGYRSGIEAVTLDDLAPGEVVIKAVHSSVNFKDALAGTGQGKILRRFPLVGGIDVAGHVVASSDPKFKEGDEVLVTGSGLSETRDGGYSQYTRQQAQWVIALPKGLSLRESMILGTAGFTAALALLRMSENRQTPELGPLAVTGATRGVGSLAVDIFSRAGFEVHAISGKAEHADYLTSIGATRVLGRDALATTRPMESSVFGGGLAGPDRALRQRRQRRPRRIARIGHDGDALHHPGRVAAGRGIGRYRPRHPRSGLAASGQRLEASPPRSHLHTRSRSGGAAGGLRDHARRRVLRADAGHALSTTVQALRAQRPSLQSLQSPGGTTCRAF